MAILLDADIGVNDFDYASGTSRTLTTTAAAAGATRIVVFCSYFSSSPATAVTIGATAAALDKRTANGLDVFDIWSAHVAGGLATGSSIVITGGQGGGLLIGAQSFTGIATSSAVVTTSSATGTATAWSSGAATNTGQANAIYTGGSGNEDNTNPTTWTATSGTKIHDRYRAADAQGFGSGYKIVSTVASDAVTGNWSNAASTANTGALVIYAEAAGAAPAVRRNRMPQTAVFRSVR